MHDDEISSETLPISSTHPVPPYGSSPIDPNRSAEDDKGGEVWSPEEVVEQIGFGPFQWRLLVMCGMPNIADAMEILLLGFIAKRAQRDFGCSDIEISLVASCVFFGMFFGSNAFGLLSDRIGRRKCFAATMLFIGASGLLSALSPTVWVLIITRMLVGFGCGGNHIGFTLYTEFLPTKTRSLQLTLMQTWWTLGVILQSTVAWAMEDISWRWLVVFSAFPGLACFAMYFFLPESPRYLLLQGRHDEAVEIFNNMAEKNGSRQKLPAAYHIVTPVHRKDQRGIGRLFETKEIKSLTIALGILWFSAAGIYYGVSLLTSEVTYSGDPYVANIVVSLSEVPAYVATYFCAIYFGRKRGMLVSAASTTICLALIVLKNYGTPGWFMLPVMFFCRGCASVLFALVTLYTQEAFPTPIRSTGSGVCGAMARIAGVVTPLIAIQLNSLDDKISVGIYCGFGLLGIIACTTLPFDTTGRALKDEIS